MAENLGLFRCPLPIFIFFLFHGSVLSVVNGDLWKIHCISLKDHSVCEKKNVFAVSTNGFCLSKDRTSRI